MADEDLDLDVEGGEQTKGSKKKLIIIIAAVVLLLIITVVGTMFFLGVFDDEPVTEGEAVSVEMTDSGESAAPAEPKSIEYWPLEPPFVLNFEGKSQARYMQISMEVMAEQKSVIEAVKLHSPALRDKIVLLLSSQKYVELATPEGKEQLRRELLETIRKELEAKNAPSDVKNIYFTSFVMQ